MQLNFSSYDIPRIIDYVQRIMGSSYSVMPRGTANIQVVYNTGLGVSIEKSVNGFSAQAVYSIICSAVDDGDAYNKLLEYFWGYSPQDKSSLPEGRFNKDVAACNHDWIEVTLFHTPQLRCRFCDIKKSSINTSES